MKIVVTGKPLEASIWISIRPLDHTDLFILQLSLMPAHWGPEHRAAHVAETAANLQYLLYSGDFEEFVAEVGRLEKDDYTRYHWVGVPRSDSDVRAFKRVVRDNMDRLKTSYKNMLERRWRAYEV